MMVTTRRPNPNCDASFTAEPERLGRPAKYKKCGTRFVLSHDGEVVEAGPPEPDP